jgi:short-subunit dehydrogenase
MKKICSEKLLARYGPWAVVTGASSGIGRECAIWLAAVGFDLVLVARRGAELQHLARELGRPSRIVVADLADGAGLATVEAATADLDVGLLVAAAGFGTSGPFLDGYPQVERAMLDLNCAAVLSQSRHFGARFVQRGRGGLVLFGSLVGFQGAPWAANYAATKAYVQTLAEGLHVELASHCVDVIASAPGPVHSGFATRARMKMSTAEQPATVARATLEALGRKMTVTPGLLSKFLTFSLMTTPRSLRSRIMGRIMGGMALSSPGQFPPF